MAFTGNEGAVIQLTEASAMTSSYRQTIPSAGIKGHFFGKNIIKTILSQTGVVGIRMYYGIDAAGVKQLVLVGTDAEENDLYNAIVADRSVPCPSRCGTANPLNS